MAGSIKDLIVRIMVDDSEVEKFQKAGSKALDFGNVLDKAAIASAGVLAGLAAGAVVVGKAASDMEQSAGGVDAVFGKFAANMHRNADAAAEAVGLSANAYNEFATVLGSQLKNAGVPMDQLGGKTQDLIKKASDLAATFGGPTSDAVEAISAAMKGEMDPIEKYGISLNQAMLQQQAATMGVQGSLQTWDNATKQSVILAAITKQGGDAWGQFAKQGDTAAEQQQKMQASLANTSAKLGTVLLPVMSSAANMLGKFGKWAGDNAGLVQVLAAGIGTLAAGVIVISGAMKVWAAVQALQTAAQWANNSAWLASPVTWIVLAIIAGIALLVAAGVWLAQNWGGVTKWLGDAWSWLWNTILKPVVDAIGAAINWLWTTVIKPVGDFIGSAVKAIGDVFNWLWANILKPVVDFIGAAIRGVAAVFTWWWQNITMPVVNGIVAAIQFMWGFLKPIFELLWALIQIGAAVFIWLWQNAVVPAAQGIGAIFSWLWTNVMQPVFDFIGAAIQAVGIVFNWLYVNVVQPAFQGIATVSLWVWNSIIQPVFGFIGAAIQALGVVFTWLYANIVQPAFQGIGTVFSWVWNTVISPIASFITNAINTIGNVVGTVFGAMGDVIRGAFNGVVSFVRGIFNGIIDAINGVIGGINAVGGTIGKAVGIDIHVSKIPRLATGGIVTAPTFAQVGEAGPEAVIPLRSPAARSMLGGSDGPTELSDKTIDKLARALAGYARVQARQGVA